MTATQQASMQGFPPRAKLGEGNPEAEKYGRMWERAEYRKVAPGENFAPLFLARAKPRQGATAIDFGCGTGRGALALSKAGLNVTMIDFVRNCLDEDVRQACGDNLSFLKADLEQKIPATTEYGYCTDVMEHIPEMRVERVLKNILDAAQYVFFAICTVEDSCGDLIDERLHMTVHDYGWWLRKLAAQDCIIEWSDRADSYCFFYVTSWKTGREVVKSGVLNAGDETIRNNVKHNISQGWEQVRPHEVNDLECMILGGGPTLGDFEDDIKRKRVEGVKLLTLNGAYNWALEHGLTPSAQFVVDARPFNARFTKPVVDGCKYIIGSQCDPAVLEGLPKDRTYLWHSNPKLIEDLLNEQYEAWYSVPGGSSILLRAIPLMRMLGYRKFHLYGCDSCIVGDRHHAYTQPENDGGLVLPVIINPGTRIFHCNPWQVSQAQEFMDLVKAIGDEIELAIYGDGLLEYILRLGADCEIGEAQ